MARLKLRRLYGVNQKPGVIRRDDLSTWPEEPRAILARRIRAKAIDPMPHARRERREVVNGPFEFQNDAEPILRGRVALRFLVIARRADDVPAVAEHLLCRGERYRAVIVEDAIAGVDVVGLFAPAAFRPLDGRPCEPRHGESQVLLLAEVERLEVFPVAGFVAEMIGVAM